MDHQNLVRLHSSRNVGSENLSLQAQMKNMAKISKYRGGGKLTEVQQITPKLYFGELTFYPGCGFEEFIPEGWDYKMGQLINLN